MTDELLNKTVDPAAKEMLKYAYDNNISTMFSRVEEMKRCPIGAEGRCCKNCSMGPCRFTGKDYDKKVGICGATLSTVAARNLGRAIAGGASAHSDHGRDLALTLKAVAKGEAPGYEIKDEQKLYNIAEIMGVETNGRDLKDIALDVANRALEDFGRQEGIIYYVSRAPKRRQEIWKKSGIEPRGVDREVVEMMHRTHIGVDQDAENILRHVLRTSLSDGWGGSMLATDISDILFGTPKAVSSTMNLGVLKEDEVNLVIHGHEPTLSEMIATVADDPELIDYAKSKGAKGINLTGICCTAIEVLMRQGVPVVGNFLQQELAILTGAVDAMVVDIQCIIQALGKLVETNHTELITTSPKAKIPGATHIPFDEHNAPEIAKQIIMKAIDNFPNRNGTRIPKINSPIVAGFSHEYINYMLGGKYRASFRPLNDAIVDGRIQGVVGVVGCNNPRVTHDKSHNYLVKELISRDYLVAQTGCGAIACSKYGLLTPEAMEHAGEGLRSICEALGIPPVLHLGSCVDNSRVLTILTQVVHEGGLGDDISDLPAAGIAPEWMSEKALSIGTYFVASGLYVLFGVGSPVGGSSEVTKIISNGWEKLIGGKLEFEPDMDKILEKTIDHIQKKRKALGIHEKKERVLFDMEARRALEIE
ncbi:MAG: anaerobic carbon-monoxide dehydrogenase catalytic subunit [Actinomycetia bacterium]|nr:anaerobic carbon-monoxide dehydrogenase catalytic subunit [Actinomycetes bacterium]